MQKVYLTVGIPASGKSSWAKEYSSGSCAIGNPITVIERDKIRATLSEGGDLNNYKYSKGRESLVTDLFFITLKEALLRGDDVIISDTNLNRTRRHQLEEYIMKTSPLAQVSLKVFDTSLRTCVKRNLKRNHSVPESALVRMEMLMREYLGKPLYERVEGLPSCIIVDIDGTVADMRGIRSPFEWHRVGEDTPIKQNIQLIEGYTRASTEPRAKVIFFSGRDSVCRRETEMWLNKHITWDNLYMRPADSKESDDIIKERLYLDHIHGKFNVDFVMDDRKQVVQLWESMGLNVINVGGTLSDF